MGPNRLIDESVPQGRFGNVDAHAGEYGGLAICRMVPIEPATRDRLAVADSWRLSAMLPRSTLPVIRSVN